MPERPASSSSLSERARQLLAEIRSLSALDFVEEAPSVVRERYEVMTLTPWSCRVPCRVAVPVRVHASRVAV